MSDIIMAHIDYENIHWRFPDYVEYITVDDIVDALERWGKN
jgi:hypothetical protein